MKKNLAVIILAAGKGERMKSALPKVLHPLCGREMLAWCLDLARSVRPKKIVAVLGYKQEAVRKFLHRDVKTVLQKKLCGTADAVKIALTALKNFKGTILILYADNPLLKKETLSRLLKYHRKNNLDATLLTAWLEKPAGYGRILRDKYNAIRAIVEEKDADDFQKDIKEINTGIACFNKEKLVPALKGIKPNNRKKEYYLTDAIGIIYKRGGLIDAVKLSDTQEALGINSRSDLASANGIMQRRINEALMQQGVTIVDPGSTFISYGTKIGPDTVIYPFTVIEQKVRIGKRCLIGPFIHLREDTRIADDVTAGNFSEIVRSTIGARTFAKHFCYLGDSRLGRAVNIGAGAVTANFDGRKKNITVIKDKAFIGSGTVLVAPVKVGKNAVTGAGSAVVKGVRDNTVVVGVPAKPLKNKK